MTRRPQQASIPWPTSGGAGRGACSRRAGGGGMRIVPDGAAGARREPRRAHRARVRGGARPPGRRGPRAESPGVRGGTGRGVRALAGRCKVDQRRRPDVGATPSAWSSRRTTRPASGVGSGVAGRTAHHVRHTTPRSVQGPDVTTLDWLGPDGCEPRGDLGARALHINRAFIVADRRAALNLRMRSHAPGRSAPTGSSSRTARAGCVAIPTRAARRRARRAAWC